MNGKFLIGTAALSGTAILMGQLSAAGGGRGFELAGAGGGDVITGGNYDVAICRISSLNDFGKIGTYPDGTTGLAFSTTSLNAGSLQLPWFVSPSVHHPIIGMNMYRVNAEGRIEQIGQSWLKHGWFAVQGTTCGSCNSSGTGTILGVGCADTYGAGLNADQFWLGPRWEESPNEHLWMNGVSWSGSHFQRNSQNGDSGSHVPIQHLLRCRMGDLTTPDSTYFYEGFYHMNKLVGDQTWGQLDELPEDSLNNTAYRQVIPNHNGNGNFSFSNTGPSHTYGPVINMWGDVQGRAQPETDGTVWVSSRKVDLGGGLYRYEYAVHNYSLTGEVNSFSVPVPDSANVTDIGFHCPRDGYWDGSGAFVNEAINHTGTIEYDHADWTTVRANGMVTFSPPNPEGGIIPNNIRYGTTFTYWFTADADGVEDSNAVITPWNEGTVTELLAQVTAPGGPSNVAALDDFEVTYGTYLSGQLDMLLESDQSWIRLNSSPYFLANEANLAELQVGATSPHMTPSRLDIVNEMRANTPNAVCKVKLYNWDTDQYDIVDQYTLTTSDETYVTANVPNPGAYVRDGDGRIEVRFRTSVAVSLFANGFVARHDVVEFQVTE